MSLISDAGNLRSPYPNTLDTFTARRDGTGVDSTLSLEIINKIETAILRVQEHTQRIPRIADGGSRKQVILSTTVAVTGTPLTASGQVTLSAAQLLMLGSQPFRLGNVILADVYRYSGTDAYMTDIVPLEPNKVIIVFRDMERLTNLTAGTYHLKVTLLGL